MSIVARKKRQWKKKVSQKREIIQDRLALAGMDDIEVKVELIQSLIPLGLRQVEEELQAEVTKLASRWYQHGKINTRWSKQNGSVRGALSITPRLNYVIYKTDARFGRNPDD